MDMTLYDLLDAYEFADIEDTFSGLHDSYARNAVGYEEVFETLKEIDDTVLSDFKIRLTDVDGDEVIEPFVHLSGISDSEDVPVSLTLTPWKEWLGMKIEADTLENYPAKDIICHSLFEMTFFGFTEEKVQGFLNSIEHDLEKRIFHEIEDCQAIIDDLEDEEDTKEVLKEMLKNEIESSSSSEDALN
jgi:hypothetical protein